jgi:putative cell wall-binding protein
VAGKDRYHTAALLAAQYGQVDHVYVATGEGENFPDALSGGALAGSEGVPVLLVRGDSVPGAVTQVLAHLGDPEVTILGGEVAVSQDVADELGATDRLAGKNRYLTSVAVAERFGYSEENPADAVYVATGEDYPDALAGSALAGWQDVPVMLSRQASVPSGVLSAMVGISPAAVFILGGEVALSEAVEAELEETFNTGASSTVKRR